MGDRMRPIAFDKLIDWVLEENKREKSVFGVPREKIFRKTNDKVLHFCGGIIENPLGPAAGPHTQLAQNIISSYVAGSRFFELKTVQKLDGEGLPVSKPCISAEDEGYNVEWSTELTVPDAFNEYVKAWFVLNVLAEELALGSNKGFMFNMSVGYDLEGIKSAKIDAFIEGLKDASRSPIWKECRDYLQNNTGKFRHTDKVFIERISPAICTSITLSTLHGCPPQEIERIARYLLGEKGLHTFVKCNPTLLGYAFARETLDKMGYDYLEFDDLHFRNDLQFSDAVPMITRLKAYAEDLGLTFGVKLSNTFPVKIANNELPGEEMYMSGRPLYPLTINLAYKLAKAFDGDLRISYSGGADFFNIDRIYKTGIWPITMATGILKPGGYLRLKQTADLLEEAYTASEFSGIDLEMLKSLAESATGDSYHLKERRGFESRKLKKKVPLTDCFIAPCTNGCPIGQDIPEYIRLAGEGRYMEALEVITEKNPLPFITGTLCNHRCMSKCTRLDFDEPVTIRDVKLLAARNAFGALLGKLKTPAITSSFKAAVIGGGPAGLAAAYFLGRNGIDVTVFERKDDIGGVMRHVAPDFRISKEAIDNDMELIRKMGVKFRLGVDGEFSLKALKTEGFKYIFIAIGAWKPGSLKLDPCDREILNVLDFLEAYKTNRDELKLGKTVVVVGAGNSAMDAARSAKRTPGVENVYVVYRRTRRYMPADREEIKLALEDGVRIKELLAPVSFTNGILVCQKMRLGAPDPSGRRSPVAISGETVELKADSVIAAVGEQVETGMLIKNGIELDSRGRIKVDPETNETSAAGVCTGGDALRGPATIVEGIADGAKFAETVMKKENIRALKYDSLVDFDREKQLNGIVSKKGVLKNACVAEKENERCLECGFLCNICVEVCPNRANVSIAVSSKNLKCRNQVVHMDGMCNECGNCETFCPYDSAPYKDKFTLYRSRDDFEDSSNAGFVPVDKASGAFTVRLGDKVTDITFDPSGKCSGDIPEDIAGLIWTIYKSYQYMLI